MMKAMSSMGKEYDFDLLKDIALTSIQNILVTQYNVPKNLAYTLIQHSKIDQIFERNAEIASHTSNKTWAKRAYENFNEDNSLSDVVIYNFFT